MVGERRRETEKERDRDRGRERRGSETDVQKLYTYNEYEHPVCIQIISQIYNNGIFEHL